MLKLDTPEERIINVRRQRWIGYDRAKKILETMDDMLNHPKAHRMPGLLIIGDTNTGKTMLANRFIQLHQKESDKSILLVQTPPGPDEGGFYDCISQALSEPYLRGRSLSQKLFSTIDLLEKHSIRLLIIDEIHNIVTGSVSRQRLFLNVLKYLSNSLHIPLIGLGTREALRAVQADPQLANRFKPAPLPAWRLDKQYLKLLASFEKTLPLKEKSNLIEEKMARKLLIMSEGSLGELTSLLSEAAIFAIKTGEEKISEKTLVSVEWTPPKDRYKAAERFF